MSGSTSSPDGGNKRHSAQVGRVIRVVEALAGHEFAPLSTSDVARATGVAAPVATRDLQALAHFGWVERTPDGKWRLYRGHITNIAVAVQSGIQRASSRMNDEMNNYTRGTY